MIKSVLVRPKMYTLSGTYGEVVAFLEGYYSGIAKIKTDFDGKYEWTFFLEWLKEKIGQSNKSLAISFLDAYPKETLEKFNEYYFDFLTESLIALVEKIKNPQCPDEEAEKFLTEFSLRVPHPEASDLIFWPSHHGLGSNPSAKEIVKTALNYKPLQL